MSLLNTLLTPLRITTISIIGLLTACGGGEGPGGTGPTGIFIGDTRPNVNCEPEFIQILEPNFQVDGLIVLGLSGEGGVEFTTNTVLKSGCYLTSNQLIVPDNVQLTISPNTIIMFRGQSAGLSIFGGNIIANGSPNAPIYFTGEGDNPIKWAGIRILRRSSSENIFNYTLIEHAGSGSFIDAKAAFSIIHKRNDTDTLKGRITFTNNVIRETSPVAEYAFLAQHHSFFNTISNNTFYKNPNDHISITVNEVHFIDGKNKFSYRGIGNLLNSIVVTNSLTSVDETLDTSRSPEASFVDSIIWQKQEIPYLIEDNIQISNTTLTIEAGTELQFLENAGLNVVDEKAALIALGTSTQKIKFTKADSNTVNARRNPTFSWKGLQFKNSILSSLDYTEIQFGGNDEINKGNISLRLNSQVKVNNSKIQHSQTGYGIHVDNSSRFTSFSNNQVSDNIAGAGLVSIQALHSLDLSSNYTGNLNDYIEVDTLNSNIDSAATIPGINIPYAFFNDFYVNGNLTINPGAELLFAQGKSMIISGNTLTAIGEPSKRIILGSLEPLLSGNISYWDGLLFNSSGSRLEYVTIQHAGFRDGKNEGHAGIRVISNPNQNSILIIENITIVDLDQNAHGIFVDSNSSLLNYDERLNNIEGRICREASGEICTN